MKPYRNTIIGFIMLATTAIILNVFTTVEANEAVKPPLNIVFIGNSITQGVLLPDASIDAPPAQTALFLRKLKSFDSINYANIGVSGSTTVDWLPVTGRLFSSAINAGDKLSNNEGTLVFSIMLGTNDSAIKGPNGSPVSPTNYNKNLSVIIDSLSSRYPTARFILHRPIWYSPNTYNGAMYLEEGLNRLISYTPQLKAITQKYPKRKVMMGDDKAFTFFRVNHKQFLLPEAGNQGTFYLHPNKEGAEKLAEFWSNAILKCLK